MSACSRCRSRVPDPWCPVCRDDDDSEAREEAEERDAKIQRETED